ncbi:MAG: hypothetical protein DRP00_03670, partial [Candidatus Aenigmatarchaeota archaeon]
VYNITANASKPYYYSISKTKLDAFELRYRPEIWNEKASPLVEGWGYRFTINLSLRDYDVGDQVNISLWKSYDKVNWVYVNSTNCTDCTSAKSINFYQRFSCNDYLNGPILYFKFNASDIYGLERESSIFNVTLEKDDIRFIVVQGSGTSIDREGLVTGLFQVLVNDSDMGQPVGSGINGTFYFSKTPTPTWVEGHSVLTNSNSYLTYNFDPTCEYQAGTEYWKVEVVGEECYKDEELWPPEYTIQTYLVKGQLKNNLLLPPQNSIFNVTDSITIRFNVSTDCSNDGLINDATVDEITLIHGNEEYPCSNINNENNGYYNCTWDSTGKPEGNYSIRISTSRNDYNSNTTLYPNRFWLENREPTYSNLLVTPQSGGWGDRYIFNVTVQDPENDSVTCWLYVNTTGQFILKGNQTISTPGNCSIQVEDFTCQDIGIASFYFEINDTFNRVNTSILNQPQLNKDLVLVEYVQGNGSEVNRSGDYYTTFKVRVKDLNRTQTKGTEKYAITPNGTFWITSDGINFNYWFNVEGDGNGYLSLDFNPNCSFEAGKQYWIAGVKDDNCYIESNLSTNITFYVIGNLFGSIIQPNGEKYLRGSNITVRANVSDECNNLIPLANVSFESIKGSEIKECSPVVDESNGYYNCTFNTSGFTPQYWDIRINGSKEYYNSFSVVENNAFWIETNPILFAPRVIPEVGGWGETFTFKVNFTDEDLDTLTVTYTLVGPTSQPSGTATAQGINTEVSWSGITFSSTDIGEWVVWFNVSDDFGYSNVSKNFTVEKDDVAIEYVEGNESTVNRVSGSVLLKLRAVDIDNPNQLVSYQPAAFWVTTDSDTPESWGPTISTSTDDYGNFSIYFDPDCTYGVGKQKWKGGLLTNDYWKEVNSSLFNITITSEYQPYITKPIGEILLRGVDDLIIKGNLTDLAGCGGVENGTVDFIVPEKNYVCIGIEEGNGIYNCTIPSSVLGAWAYGWYNLTMNATRPFYPYAETLQPKAFYLADDPDLANPTVSPSSAPWGSQFVFNVTLTDLDQDNATVYLWIRRPGRDWEVLDNYTYAGATPGTGANIGFVWNTTCEDVDSNIEYKFNVSDTSGYKDEIYGGTFSVNKRGVTLFVTSGEGDKVDREGSSSTQLSVRVRDVFAAQFVGAGVNGSFFIESKEGIIKVADVQTDPNGYLNYTFDPNCSFNVGKIEWIGSVINDKCYVSTNISSYLNITGQLKNNLLLPPQNSIFNVTDSITIRFNTTSDCSNEGLIPNASVSIELKSPLGIYEPCSVNN